jgi:hypothetical protein
MAALRPCVAGRQQHPKGVEVRDRCRIPGDMSSCILWKGLHPHLDTNLLVDTCLLVFNILLELLQGCRVGSRPVGLEYCDVTAGAGLARLTSTQERNLLVCEWCDLLLGLLVVGEVLLVLLPALSGGARHGER